MVAGPSDWLKHVMQLTYISWDFRLLVIALGTGYVALAWIGENYVFQRLARVIGQAKETITQTSKKRKEYKVIQERMLF